MRASKRVHQVLCFEPLQQGLMHAQGSVQRGHGLCQNSFRARGQLLDPIQTPSMTYRPQLLKTGIQCYVQGLVWADKAPPADSIEHSSTELLRIGSELEMRSGI